MDVKLVEFDAECTKTKTVPEKHQGHILSHISEMALWDGNVDQISLSTTLIDTEIS